MNMKSNSKKVVLILFNSSLSVAMVPLLQLPPFHEHSPKYETTEQTRNGITRKSHFDKQTGQKKTIYSSEKSTESSQVTRIENPTVAVPLYSAYIRKGMRTNHFFGPQAKILFNNMEYEFER